MTVALVAPAQEVAATAVAASAQPVLVGKKRVEVDGITVVVSRKGPTAMGRDGEALSARKPE